MKYRYLYTLFILFTCLILNAKVNFAQPQPGFGQGELLIINQTKWYASPGQKILLKIIPVGATFHGDESGHNQYSPVAINRVNFNIPRVITDSFIVGYQKILQTELIDLQNKIFVLGAWDGASSNHDCNFTFGMALYKIEFWSVNESEGPDSLLNYLFVDYRNANINIPYQYQYTMDLRIEYFSNSLVTFNFFDDSNRHNIDTVGKLITHWHQFGGEHQNLNRQPNKGNFVLDSSTQEYLKLPINLNQYNNNIGQENPGDIGMNLLINHNVTSRDTLIDTITNINITNKSVLKISAYKTFDLITPVSPLTGRTNVTVEDSSGLSLLTNSKIIIRDRNKLILKQNSFVKSFPGSELIIHPGGTFCNEGSEIVGPLTIRYLSGIFPVCAITSAFEIKDSTSIVLSDSAVLELPDDYTLHISGKESSLILNPHSKIKFGENSKIIVDSSATLIANGATFTSLDSTQKWDGIILNNSGADTITNCTFSNAVTALTFTKQFKLGLNG